LRLDADEDNSTADTLLEIADQVKKRKAMGCYVVLANLLFVDDENSPRLISPDGRVDDKNVGRPKIPDEAGRTLGSLPGIKNSKFPGSALPDHLVPQQANTQAARGIIAFPPVPDPQHKQAFGLLEFPRNGLEPIGIRTFERANFFCSAHCVMAWRHGGKAKPVNYSPKASVSALNFCGGRPGRRLGLDLGLHILPFLLQIPAAEGRDLEEVVHL